MVTHWLTSYQRHLSTHLVMLILAKVEVVKRPDTLGDVKAMALVDVLAYMLDTDR